MDKEDIFLMRLQKMNSLKYYLNGLIEKRNSSDYQVSEVHCIELIGKLEDANGKKLSKASHMTKGAISKIINKLLGYGAIESYRKAESKKEIYYKLTTLGEDISAKHEKLHKELMESDKIIFQQLNEQEQNSVIKFLEIYTEHLNNELKKLGIQR